MIGPRRPHILLALPNHIPNRRGNAMSRLAARAVLAVAVLLLVRNGGPIAAHFAINFLNLRYIVGSPVRADAHS